MNSRPLLDTHIWIWWVNGDRRLDAETRAGLDALPSEDRPYLSAISLWEVAVLVDRQRIALTIPLQQWLRDASAPTIVEAIAITVDIAAETARFPRSFHRDPADRLIVATSRVLAIPLATDDRRILRSRLAQSWTPPT